MLLLKKQTFYKFAVLVVVVLTVGFQNCSTRGGEDDAQLTSSSCVESQNCPTPEMSFSASAGGSSSISFRTTDTIYGKVQNGGVQAKGCAEYLPFQSGYCDDLTHFSVMPNGDWSYSTTTALWTSTVLPDTQVQGTYRFYWLNGDSGLVSQPIEITVKLPPPMMYASKSPSGSPAETQFALADTIYFFVKNGPANDSQGCLEVVGINDGHCANLDNFVDQPNPDWSFDQMSGLWRSRGLTSAELGGAGTTKSFWRNKFTEDVSPGLAISRN